MTERAIRQAGLAVFLVAACAGMALADPSGATAPDGASMSPVTAVPQSLLLDYLADKSAFTLIDARSPEEYAESHIGGAINIPYDQLDRFEDALPAPLDGTVVVYCRTGRRAGKLQSQLAERGYSDVRVLQAEQIYSSDGLMTFNCGTTEAQAPARKPDAAADAAEETQ